MIYIAYTIHVVVCLSLILVVLLQQGKGADLSVFGGGSTQSAFGARGAATLLHKLTVFGFVAFILTTVAIGFMQGGASTGSVMSTVQEQQIDSPASVESDAADEIPAPAEIPAEGGEEAGSEVPPVDGESAESEDPTAPDPSSDDR